MDFAIVIIDQINNNKKIDSCFDFNKRSGHLIKEYINKLGIAIYNDKEFANELIGEKLKVRKKTIPKK